MIAKDKRDKEQMAKFDVLLKERDQLQQMIKEMAEKQKQD